MQTDWNEERKRGALAIEQEIDRQLAGQGFPEVARSWICDKAGFGSGIEFVYTRSDGRTVSGKFNAHELKWFCRRHLPETLIKINDVVARIVAEPPNGLRRSPSQ